MLVPDVICTTGMLHRSYMYLQVALNSFGVCHPESLLANVDQFICFLPLRELLTRSESMLIY